MNEGMNAISLLSCILFAFAYMRRALNFKFNIISNDKTASLAQTAKYTACANKAMIKKIKNKKEQTVPSACVFPL